jgi:uncharacterized membrane protein YeaQ/YmgE (transglycosylase-associated protein family)
MPGFSVLGAMLVGALTGFLAERGGLVRNGVTVSVLLGLAGGVLAWLLTALTGLGLGGRTVTAILGALAALFIAPRLGRR